MKKFIALALLFAANAFGATATTPLQTNEAWSMKRDTTVFGPVFTSYAACVSAARAHAETAQKSANYSCSDIRPFRVTYTAAPVPCAVQPSNSTATVACAAGFAPPWQQTTTVTVGAPPSCTVTTTLNPPVAPAGACQPTGPAPAGTVLHFSTTGSNANPGTEASPKRDLSSITGACGSDTTARTGINCLPAGSALRFQCSGSFALPQIILDNLNVTAAAPFVLESYGGCGRATLTWSGGHGFQFGSYNSSTMDGGYVIRGLRIVGTNGAGWGLWVQGTTRSVVIEDNEITGFQIGLHAQNSLPLGNVGLTIRGNNIHHNSEMGMLGDAHDLVMEGNTFADNNFSGSGFNHGVYLGSHSMARNAIVRNNTFTNNSAVSGVCTGGNLTVHGLWDGLLIENNTVQQAASTFGCWGISITDGYTDAEVFRNTVVRGNKVINLESAIAVRGAPGIVIEGNVFRSNQLQLASGVTIVPPNGANDDPGFNPVVRDNLACFTDTGRVLTNAVNIQVAGGTETGTVLRTGANATTGVCVP